MPLSLNTRKSMLVQLCTSFRWLLLWLVLCAEMDELDSWWYFLMLTVCLIFCLCWLMRLALVWLQL
jgi:hypothetical protein